MYTITVDGEEFGGHTTADKSKEVAEDLIEAYPYGKSGEVKVFDPSGTLIYHMVCTGTEIIREYEE